MIGNQYVTLTAIERAALASGSGFDISGTAIMGQSALSGGGLYFFQGSSAAGETHLKLDFTNGQLVLTSEGSALATTTGLSSTPAAPTYQNFVYGDRFDWRIWDLRTGAARSAGIRVAVNGCCGVDTVVTHAGSAFTTLTSAVALGNSSTTWQPTNSLLSGSLAANITPRGVILGDSICAPRSTTCAIGARLGGLGATGPIVSLAQAGARADQQLTTWQNSHCRGNASVVWVYIQVGVNDIVQGASAATTLGRIQSLVNDIAANNPTAAIFVGTMTPARFYMTTAVYAVWTAVNTGILGGGGTPITGITAAVNTTTNLTDGNDNLLYYDTAIDPLHTSELGRYQNALSVASALTTAGVFA